jgi:hypothetical protein
MPHNDMKRKKHFRQEKLLRGDFKRFLSRVNHKQKSDLKKLFHFEVKFGTQQQTMKDFSGLNYLMRCLITC